MQIENQSSQFLTQLTNTYESNIPNLSIFKDSKAQTHLPPIKDSIKNVNIISEVIACADIYQIQPENGKEQCVFVICSDQIVSFYKYSDQIKLLVTFNIVFDITHVQLNLGSYYKKNDENFLKECYKSVPVQTQEKITVCKIVFVDDQIKILVGGHLGFIYILTPNSGFTTYKYVAAHSQIINCLSTGGQGQMFSCAIEGPIFQWSLNEPKLQQTYSDLTQPDSKCLCFDIFENQMLSSHTDAQLRLWNIVNSTLIYSFQSPHQDLFPHITQIFLQDRQAVCKHLFGLVDYFYFDQESQISIYSFPQKSQNQWEMIGGSLPIVVSNSHERLQFHDISKGLIYEQLDLSPMINAKDNLSVSCAHSFALLYTTERKFAQSLLPALVEFIKIPNVSPEYDVTWNSNGLQEKAANHLITWANEQKIKGLKLECIKEENLTPFIYGEIEGQKEGPAIIFYGHFDKQPPMLPWAQGLDPYIPVIQDNKLYGRGSVDDGYNFFATLVAIKNLQQQGIPHRRCVLLWEGDEESGRGDVEHYISTLKDRIGEVGLIIALDSGGQSYDRLWITTNLRGCIELKLKIQTLTEGVHSGDASGIVPSPFRILRQLLDRLEDPYTSQMIPDLYVEIPPNRYQEAFNTSKLMSDKLNQYPWSGKTQNNKQNFELYLNNTWRPTLCITGQDGLPSSKIAGNVLIPEMTFKLSIRVPPELSSKELSIKIKEILEKDPPYNSVVEVSGITFGDGFNSKEFTAEFWNSMNQASKQILQNECVAVGCGGSIPFMNFLQEMFPNSQFLISGCLGPNSNAHGPNEYLDLDFCKKVIGCVSKIIEDF